MGESKSNVESGPGAGSAVVGQAREAATHAAEKAKQAASRRFEQQREKSAERLSDVAEAFRRTGGELEDDAIIGYVNRAADGIERAADYIREADVGQIVERAEGYARREPALFLGGAFLFGMLGARFLRSSAVEHG